MKQLISLVALVWLVGCASTPETIAYRVIGSTTIGVDAAMNGWGDYVRVGKATPQDEVVVKKVYESYQQVMRTTKTVVMSYKMGVADQTALEKALDAVEAAKNELVNLITMLRK